MHKTVDQLLMELIQQRDELTDRITWLERQLGDRELSRLLKRHAKLAAKSTANDTVRRPYTRHHPHWMQIPENREKVLRHVSHNFGIKINGLNGKVKRHWTQTPEGRAKMAENVRKQWAGKKRSHKPHKHSALTRKRISAAMRRLAKQRKAKQAATAAAQ